MMVVGDNILCIGYDCTINKLIIILVSLNKMKSVNWKNTAYISAVYTLYTCRDIDTFTVVKAHINKNGVPKINMPQLLAICQSDGICVSWLTYTSRGMCRNTRRAFYRFLCTCRNGCSHPSARRSRRRDQKA